MLSCSVWFSAPSFWKDGGPESRCVGRVYGADGAVRLHGTIRQCIFVNTMRCSCPLYGIHWLLVACKVLAALHSPYSCQGQLQTPQSVSELLEFFAHLNNLEMIWHIGRKGDKNMNFIIYEITSDILIIFLYFERVLFHGRTERRILFVV